MADIICSQEPGMKRTKAKKHSMKNDYTIRHRETGRRGEGGLGWVWDMVRNKNNVNIKWGNPAEQNVTKRHNDRPMG